VVDNRDASQSRFFFYDDLDRLWKSTNLAGTPLFTYLYDANGNRTQQVAPGGTTTYSYQPSTDRIAQATGAAAKHYAHDAFGSRIWAGPTAYAGQPSHLYDQGNRLVEVRDPVTQAVLGQYTYDAAGRRVRKVAGGVTTLYFYDSAGHLIESQNLSTSPATRRSYVFVENEPMGVVDQPPSVSPVFSWIHTDRLGTPLAVTSTPSSGPAKVIWRATYEPFGLATPDEDPDGDSASFALDLRFPGQVFDPESGGHDNYFRYYDAVTGSYASSDPIGQRGGINVFSYTNSNPLRFIDPLALVGLTPEQCEKLREILEYEKEYGTWAAALKYGDWGDPGLPTELGPNVGVDSAVGDVDFSWLADTRVWNLGVPSLSGPVYSVGKSIWNMGKAVGRVFSDDPHLDGARDPYSDPRERRAIEAMGRGLQSFSDFWTDEFMEDNCGPDPCEP
jgi:RHS repeat-associated protein